MDADVMRERHSAAVTRYARQLADDAQIPPGLLSELAAIADAHAAEAAGATLSDAGTEDVESLALVPERPAAARTAPRRRTGARTR